MNRDSRPIAKDVLGLAVAVALILAFSAWAEGHEDVVLRAMRDELSRTTANLRMANLDSPYYVGFLVTEFQNFELDCAFGTVSRREDTRRRCLSVDLRVGDYALDNSNFITDWSGLRPRQTWIAMEDNYDALRRDMWLATDRAYKDALEKLARKRAYVETRAITDLPEDFSREKAVVDIGLRVDLDVDKAYWERCVCEFSAIFSEFPEITDSKITFQAVALNRHFLNSEGSENTKGTLVFILEAEASAQAQDGQCVYDFEGFYARDLKDFPSKEAMAVKIRELAQTTADLAGAEAITEYVGPVLFTGQASAEFFRQLLGANISSPREPLVADEELSWQVKESKLAGKVNLRILPPSIDIVDDPTLTAWEGKPLVGWFRVDDNGVPAQRTSLVENGKLVSLLMSRQPTKKITASNGHGRGAFSLPVEGRLANLIVTPKETGAAQDLREQLIAMCKDAGLEFGIIVRKVRDPNFSLYHTNPDTRLTGTQWQYDLFPPIEAYRVYVGDEREELIRGLDFEGASVRALKDIAATGIDLDVHNFTLARDYELPASIVSPSVLVEEMEMKKTKTKPSKAPVLASPLAKSRRQLQ